jgi:hypothetical protein
VSSGQAPGKDGRPIGSGTSRSGGQAGQQGIAAAITEVTERASVLIREEVELAKTEITEKATRLAKGAVVGIVAGVFFFTALFFVLIGCAWLLYYELPIGNEFTYFWGFFAMAVILVVFGVIAGLLAYKAVKAGAPPTPDMAIEEARKIRDTVSSSAGGQSGASIVTATGSPVAAAASAAATSASKSVPATAPTPASTPATAPSSGSSAETGSTGTGQESDLGRGTIDGTTLGS